MSDRANWIIVENGEAVNHYRRWGDVWFPFVLLFGPDKVLGWTKDRPDGLYTCFVPMGQSDMVLDVDRRRLLYWTWVGDEHGLHMPNFASALAVRWPGWEVRYEFGGRLSLADYLGWPLRKEDQDGGFPPPESSAKPFETAWWLKAASQERYGDGGLRFNRPLRRLMHEAAQHLRSRER